MTWLGFIASAARLTLTHGSFVLLSTLCVCVFYRGNLYYFSWGSFLVSVGILASCYEELRGGGAAAQQQANASDAEKAANGEIQIESLPPGSDQEY